MKGIQEIERQRGKVLVGGKVLESYGGFHVAPTIIEIDVKAQIVKEEIFAPILYIFKFETLEEAIEINNSVP